MEEDLKDTYPKVLPSEALMMFLAWLTTRQEEVTFSGKHNAAKAVELFKEFAKANNLEEIRNDVYPENLVMPKESA